MSLFNTFRMVVSNHESIPCQIGGFEKKSLGHGMEQVNLHSPAALAKLFPVGPEMLFDSVDEGLQIGAFLFDEVLERMR